LRAAAQVEPPLCAPSRAMSIAALVAIAALAMLPLVTQGYALVLAIDIFVFALFAASLHFILGPGGHGVLRPRRVSGPGRLRRGPAAREGGLADGGGARRRAARRGSRRCALRWFCVRSRASISPC